MTTTVQRAKGAVQLSDSPFGRAKGAVQVKLDVSTGRIMSSMAAKGGLAGKGGIAGVGGGLAG